MRLIGVECTGPFTLPAHQITFEGVDGAGLMGKGDRALVGVNVGQTVIRTLNFRNGAPAANGHGGAVHITGLSSPTIEGCRFVDNQVTGTGRGGALSIAQSNATAAGSVILRNNVFGELSHPNLAVTGFGGAIDLTAVRPIELIGNQVRSNGAGSGGGAVIIGIKTVLLEGNTFAGNVVTGTGGGALLGVLDGRGALLGNTFGKNTIIGLKAVTGVHRGAGLDVEFFGEFGAPADGRATFIQRGNRFSDNLIQNDTEARFGAGEAVVQLAVTSTDDQYVRNDIDGGGGSGAGLSVAGVKGAPAAFDGRNTVVAGNEIERGIGAGITLKPTQAVTDETLILRDATVSGNRGGPGAAGGPEDTFTATNSILTGNELGDFGFANATIAFSDACALDGSAIPRGRQPLRGPAARRRRDGQRARDGRQPDDRSGRRRAHPRRADEGLRGRRPAQRRRRDGRPVGRHGRR